MDANIQAVEDKRKAQEEAFSQTSNSDDPAAQLQGLMNAQSSLKRMTSAFSTKPNFEKIADFGKKLGFEVPDEIMKLGDNEAISNALVEMAVGMGISEDRIAEVMG